MRSSRVPTQLSSNSVNNAFPMTKQGMSSTISSVLDHTWKQSLVSSRSYVHGCPEWRFITLGATTGFGRMGHGMWIDGTQSQLETPIHKGAEEVRAQGSPPTSTRS